jgi:hypothetical protein
MRGNFNDKNDCIITNNMVQSISSKWKVTQVVNNFPVFTELERSLPH